MELFKRLGYEIAIVIIIIAVFYCARSYDAHFIDAPLGDEKGLKQIQLADAFTVIETAIAPITTHPATTQLTTTHPTTTEAQTSTAKHSDAAGANSGANNVENALIIGDIDFNRADASEIALLKGIGPVIAQRVVDYRNANGPFNGVEDLLSVKGIGPKTLEKILMGKRDNSQ